MSDWSADESDGGWSDDRSEAEWGTHETDVEWAADEAETEPEQQRLPGRHLLPTLRWAVRALRESPLLIAVALVVSVLEVFVLGPNQLLIGVPDPVWWFASLFGIMLIGAVAAVVTEDIVVERHRSAIAQMVAGLRSVPALLVTVVGFSLSLYFGALLPARLVPVLGIAFGLGVGIYLLSLSELVVPAVVLDQSIGRGRTAFAGARVLAVGLLLVLTLGHAPIAALSPTLSEPPLLIGLSVWAGVVTGITTLASARAYLASGPGEHPQTGPHEGQAQGKPVGSHGMWNRPAGGGGVGDGS